MRIVFFDGHCNLCNGFVTWLLRADPRGRIKIASLQGETARALLAAPDQGSDPESVIYLRGSERLERSAAVLQILVDLGGWRAVARVGWLIPAALRDRLYSLVARNRYRLFGRRELCRLPTPGERERERFLP